MEYTKGLEQTDKRVKIGKMYLMTLPRPMMDQCIEIGLANDRAYRDYTNQLKEDNYKLLTGQTVTKEYLAKNKLIQDTTAQLQEERNHEY